MTDSDSNPPQAESNSTPTEKRSFWSLFYGPLPLQTPTNFFILFNVLDIFWTGMLFRFGAIEANPFANYVLQKWGFGGMIAFKLIIVAFVCFIAQVIALKKVQTARFMLWFGTCLVALVVIYSSFLLFGMTSSGALPMN